MEQFTRDDLVTFGEYLLSDKRTKLISKGNKQFVHHADIENWLDYRKRDSVDIIVGELSEGVSVN